jgi:HEAT repeat protein
LSHPIIAGLASPDTAERHAACVAAADDPSAVLLLHALAEALGDPEKRVAQAASDSLAQLAQTSDEVSGVVRAALSGGTPNQRWFAAFTYSRIEPVGPRLLPPLIEALGSDAGDIRWAAARLLVNTGRAHGEVLPLMLGLARTAPTGVLGCWALYGRRALAPDEPGCAHAIAAATHDPDRSVRHAALTALASLRDAPASVIDRIVEVSTDTGDPAGQRIATFALGALGSRPQIELSESAIASLRQHAAGTHRDALRSAARRALETCGIA